MLLSADRVYGESKGSNHVKGCINVERAWQVLDECYGDDDRMVDSLLKDLDNLRS